MKKITLFAAAALISFYSKAQSFSGLYAFDSVKTTSGITDPTPLPSATGVTFGSFSATGTPANPNATGRFSFTDWSLGAANGETVYANLTGSMVASEYYEVTIAPSGSYTLSLTSITFSFGRSGTGVRTYSVRSDADAYAVNLPASISPANPNLSVQAGDVFFLNTDITTSSQNGSTITLSGASFTNLSGPRTFRFYGWNAEGTGGTFSLDNVTINGSVFLPVGVTAGFIANPVCSGDTMHFMDMSTGTYPVISWAWDFGTATGTSVQQNPSYLYMGPGAYLVTLTVIDSMLNTDTFSDSVYVRERPVAGFSAPLSICGDTVQFLDSSMIASGSITGWMWDFGDTASGINNISVLQNPMHLFSAQGNYTVTEIVSSNHGCKDTATVLISNSIVTAVLPVTFNGDTAIFAGYANGGSGPYTYLLDLGVGGGFSITTPNYMYEYPDGTYTACLLVTDNTGCTDTSCTTFTILTTGIEQHTGVSAVSISPNPSSDGVFTLSTGTTKSVVTVYNIIGKKIMSKELPEGRHTLDLSAEANGSYFVSVKTEKEVITKKIIISK